MAEKKSIKLPPALHFLNWGWWVLHVIAIPLVFVIGYFVGRASV